MLEKKPNAYAEPHKFVVNAPLFPDTLPDNANGSAKMIGDNEQGVRQSIHRVLTDECLAALPWESMPWSWAMLLGVLG